MAADSEEVASVVGITSDVNFYQANFTVVIKQ